MNRRHLILMLVVTASAALAALTAIGWKQDNKNLPTEWTDAGRLPQIRPDYCDIVIPPNIAPLNFTVEEPGIEYQTRIHGTQGEEIFVASRNPGIVIPEQPWRELLQVNRGGKIGLDIYVKEQNGSWRRFAMIENAVAQEEIDSHLAYRLLGPVGVMYRKLGIYQRNLENYDESPIVNNDSTGGCFNCHTFRDNCPDEFSFHVRPGVQKELVTLGMIVARDGKANRLETKSEAAPSAPGYHSWRRDGLAVAFSFSKTRQYFRNCGPDVRDVFDIASDLAIADAKTGAASTSPDISTPDHLETFPCWSADGKHLFYCSAQTPWSADEYPRAESIQQVKFDLMRIPYDIESNTWGEPETMLASAETGKTILEPRASPDGRHLLFCMSDYGGFPVHQPGCDLHMMNLESGEHWRLECNSDEADSWHCWSSNSRWIVFSSKRDNGFMARPYFSYIDADGRAHKPFVLPQKNPAFYDTWIKTYNVPELITGPVTVPQEELLQAVLAGSATTGGAARDNASWRATTNSPMQ
ncbi:PD40 domain-containing protein [Candidatus Sumerlaeota bacterium]|nr:PD40 domain-containing protein [Candidatus Sumerlaeota bacterium]